MGFPLGDRERHAPKGFHGAERFGNVVEFEARHDALRRVILLRGAALPTPRSGPQ
jgi:hypothetical protein